MLDHPTDSISKGGQREQEITYEEAKEAMGGGEQRKVRSVFPGLGCEGAERDGQ